MPIFLKSIYIYGQDSMLLSKLFSYYLNRNVRNYLDFSILENHTILFIFKNTRYLLVILKGR
ncbi:Hypothetical Protein SiL_1048 [Sulfolobus islandicus LAL14/1]|uniref:Uncharacterized protein n=1 Tax=Saccharolobus islandicus LAL14/1 TaxID=1241935 RepID=M9U8S5_SACIS|nr:Hypothetical Protein SiL_1048 [Sulfolobus islandicus LAL14/1]